MAVLLYYPLVIPPTEIVHQALLYWDGVASVVPRESEIYDAAVSAELKDLKQRGLYMPLTFDRDSMDSLDHPQYRGAFHGGLASQVLREELRRLSWDRDRREFRNRGVPVLHLDRRGGNRRLRGRTARRDARVGTRRHARVVRGEGRVRRRRVDRRLRHRLQDGRTGRGGGEGFVFEKFTGQGTVIIAGAGNFIDLNPAEFGGEGLSPATLEGNGRVILQSLTIESLANALKKAQGGDKQGPTGGLFSTSRGESAYGRPMSYGCRWGLS